MIVGKRKQHISARSLERYGLGGAVSFDLHSIPPTFEGASIFIPSARGKQALVDRQLGQNPIGFLLVTSSVFFEKEKQNKTKKKL